MEYPGFADGDISKIGENSPESDGWRQTRKPSQPVLVWRSEHEMIREWGGGTRTWIDIEIGR